MEDDWAVCFNGEQQVLDIPVQPIITPPTEKLSAEELIKVARMNEYIPEKNQDPNIKSQCIDEIIEKTPRDLGSCELIQMQCSVACFIQSLTEKKISNASSKANAGDFRQPSSGLIVFEREDTASVLEYFQWISRSSLELAARIGQTIITPAPGKEILRSSYSFCPRSTHCKFFYSKVEAPTCQHHHFVHALLKHDVDSVINYLNHILKLSGTITMIEISNLNSSINTICYVARRMSKEISFIDQRTEGGSEQFHRDNPIDIGHSPDIDPDLAVFSSYLPPSDGRSGGSSGRGYQARRENVPRNQRKKYTPAPPVKRRNLYDLLSDE